MPVVPVDPFPSIDTVPTVQVEYTGSVYEFTRLTKNGRLALKFRTFTLGWGKDCGSISILVLFWICVILLIPSYVWTSIHVIKWSVGFPETEIYIGIWCHWVSLYFGCGWVPFAILLTDWEKQLRANRKSLLGCYLIGTFLCVGFSSVSIWIASKYATRYDQPLNSTLIYAEWLKSTKKSFAQGKYPPWLHDFKQPLFFDVDCCGWNGPLDLGDPRVLAPSDLRIPGQKLTMQILNQVKACYNHLFVVTKNGTKFTFKPNPAVLIEELPSGCGEWIEKDLQEVSCLIIVSGSIAIALSVGFLITYSFYPVCFYARVRRSAELTNRRYKMVKKAHPSIFRFDSTKANGKGNYES